MLLSETTPEQIYANLGYRGTWGFGQWVYPVGTVDGVMRWREATDREIQIWLQKFRPDEADSQDIEYIPGEDLDELVCGGRGLPACSEYMDDGGENDDLSEILPDTGNTLAYVLFGLVGLAFLAKR